jgi:hypothetical protein
MLDKRLETRWFAGTIVFLVLYCIFLFLFRAALVKLDTQFGSILKPEVSQILAIALIILLYYFAFLGLYGFSGLGRWQRTVSIFLAMLFTGSLLYGFRQWYTAVVNNPFLSFGPTGVLPWYAREKTKFLLANTPLALFIITIFIMRIIMRILLLGKAAPSPRTMS